MGRLNTALVTGYAKAPQGTSMYESFKHAGIVLEIDMGSHKIVDAEFTFVTDLSRNFFKKLIVGYDVSKGLDELIEDIRNHYFAPSQQAVIVALQSAVQRYGNYIITDEYRLK